VGWKMLDERLGRVALIAFVLAVFALGKCDCDNWEYKLVHDLLNGYDASIRPSVNHNATLNVTFGLSLAQIIDVVIIITKTFDHIFLILKNSNDLTNF
jgi:hypothetical protein